MVNTCSTTNSVVNSKARKTNDPLLENQSRAFQAPTQVAIPPVVAHFRRQEEVSEDVQGQIQFLNNNMFNF